MRVTKTIIYSQNLINNFNEIKKNTNKNVKICCAVKADAYGNDAVNSAKILEKCKADYLAIATVEEGIELRNAGIKLPLLLLSLSSYEDFDLILKNKITPLVFDEEYINILNETASENKIKNQSVFLAVDTGMGRIGCYPEEAGNLAKIIDKSSNLKLEGMITHFAVSDSIDEKNISFTKNQFKLFMDAVENVKKMGIDPGIKTCSASAAGISFSDMQLDMIRPGIILYGYYADEVTKEYLEKKNIFLNLKPVLQFETQVCSIRHFEKGKSISYGRTYICPEDTEIAILPVGYADGLLRRNSPGLKVTINGKAYPVVGRICMDQCMVNIGKNNKEVKRWDKAIIFGPKESGSLYDAFDIAKMTNTIPYEVMTTISKRVERIIL